MKRFLITKRGNSFVIWKKTFWGWRRLKTGTYLYLHFDSPEEAEEYLRKTYPFKCYYPIVKEVNLQQ
jgi:hypothetical protein